MKSKKEKVKTDIKINPALDIYSGKILFPKKVAEANAFIKKSGLPMK